MSKLPKIVLIDIGTYTSFQTKQLGYAIETDSGCVRISVMVPYHSDDREADRVGRIELRKILGALAIAS